MQVSLKRIASQCARLDCNLTATKRKVDQSLKLKKKKKSKENTGRIHYTIQTKQVAINGKTTPTIEQNVGSHS